MALALIFSWMFLSSGTKLSLFLVISILFSFLEIVDWETVTWCCLAIAFCSSFWMRELSHEIVLKIVCSISENLIFMTACSFSFLSCRYKLDSHFLFLYCVFNCPSADIQSFCNFLYCILTWLWHWCNQAIRFIGNCLPTFPYHFIEFVNVMYNVNIIM